MKKTLSVIGRLFLIFILLIIGIPILVAGLIFIFTIDDSAQNKLSDNYIAAEEMRNSGEYLVVGRDEEGYYDISIVPDSDVVVYGFYKVTENTQYVSEPYIKINSSEGYSIDYHLLESEPVETVIVNDMEYPVYEIVMNVNGILGHPAPVGILAKLFGVAFVFASMFLISPAVVIFISIIVDKKKEKQNETKA